VIYDFEGHSLDIDKRELRSGDKLVALEPQVFDLLTFLICNSDRVVSKDDLISGVWNGRIVSDSTLNSSINAVRQAVGDSGEAQRFIRTIPRKGFRFVGAVCEASEGQKAKPTPSTAGQSFLSLPDKPSIAVLPFTNFSGDTEQAYFADGMVDEIITALSRIPWLFVIARTSTFSYRNKSIDIRQIGRELGVRYVLEGSVRKEANRVRIMPQLIDASTGTHLWAERFEGSIDRIFELQDQVTERVVGAIGPKLQQAEIERIRHKPTENLDAYDYFLRGVASFHLLTKHDIEEAISLFGKAIEIDPNYASACGMTALCYIRRKASRCMADEEKETSDALRLARSAVDLAADDSIALSTGGFALAYLGGDLDDGAAFIDRALELSPNLAYAMIFSGWVRILLGDQETAIEHFTRSMRLSPLDPFIMSSYSGVAFAHLLSGRFDEAASWAEKALRLQPKYFFTNVVCASVEAHCGRMENAQQAIIRIREADPTLRISNLRDLEPLRRPEQFAIWADGMRKAGLPD
jgi:TolB-like protein/Flp pilus assembly protein TadD